MDAKVIYRHELGKHMEFNFSKETKLKMEMLYLLKQEDENWPYIVEMFALVCQCRIFFL